MKKIDKILNFILGLAFIVIIAGGWVFSAIAYNKSYNLEKQYQADMEELEMDLNDKFYFIETAISDLKDRMEKLNDRITDLEDADIAEMQRYSKQILNELTIYEYVLEAQHDLATGKITLEEYNERMNHLANRWEEIKKLYDSDVYDYIPSLVERIEELEDIANAFDDLEDALEKALNEINARLKALESD